MIELENKWHDCTHYFKTFVYYYRADFYPIRNMLFTDLEVCNTFVTYLLAVNFQIIPYIGPIYLFLSHLPL